MCINIIQLKLKPSTALRIFNNLCLDFLSFYLVVQQEICLQPGPLENNKGLVVLDEVRCPKHCVNKQLRLNKCYVQYIKSTLF